MRNADGRYPIAGVEPNPVIIDVTDMPPRPKPVPQQVHRSSTRAKFVKGEILWDCSGGLPDKRLYDGVLGEYRSKGEVTAVVIYFDQEWIIDPRMDGHEIRNALRVNGFERDIGRHFWIDFPMTPDPGSMIAFTCRDPHQWRDEPIKKSKWVPDSRPVEEKLAEAKEFARRLEVEQKLDALRLLAWRAAMQRGEEWNES